MMIHEITALVGKYKKRKRIGRGPGSGNGKTAGKGHKGAQSRSGYSRRAASEGGQMPYFRRIPKRGFSNVNYATEFWVVNIGDIVAHDSFKNGGAVDANALVKAGLIRDEKRPLKVLGDLNKADSLGVKLQVTANRVSRSAREHIEKAGGSVTETGTRRDRIRGVDRQSGDLTPKNLTKKLKRGKNKKKPAAAKSDE
ncbi:MAG: 50S ribosomal protein L15 [Phycisphaerales bacterium]